jgi:hypothetical protein
MKSNKHKEVVENIVRFLQKELKHDAEEVNSVTGISHDDIDGITLGRYELARDTLRLIRSLTGDTQSNHVNPVSTKVEPKLYFEEQAILDAQAYVEKLTTKGRL